MLRSHHKPSVGDWIFIYSKSGIFCLSGFDSPPHIELTSFVIELCLMKNNSRQFCSSFVHFRKRDAYHWCLTTACLLSCVWWPGNLKNQSSCPAVTWQPEQPITVSHCDLAAVAWPGDLRDHDHYPATTCHFAHFRWSVEVKESIVIAEDVFLRKNYSLSYEYGVNGVSFSSIKSVLMVGYSRAHLSACSDISPQFND